MNTAVFSSGPADLVTQSIDTEENSTIHLPLRRLPITKRDVKQTQKQVQKMLDRGLLEPC